MYWFVYTCLMVSYIETCNVIAVINWLTYYLRSNGLLYTSQTHVCCVMVQNFRIYIHKRIHNIKISSWNSQHILGLDVLMLVCVIQCITCSWVQGNITFPAKLYGLTDFLVLEANSVYLSSWHSLYECEEVNSANCISWKDQSCRTWYTEGYERTVSLATTLFPIWRDVELDTNECFPLLMCVVLHITVQF
jgi:hypothetical protein